MVIWSTPASSVRPLNSSIFGGPACNSGIMSTRTKVPRGFSWRFVNAADGSATVHDTILSGQSNGWVQFDENCRANSSARRSVCSSSFSLTATPPMERDSTSTMSSSMTDPRRPFLTKVYLRIFMKTLNNLLILGLLAGNAWGGPGPHRTSCLLRPCLRRTRGFLAVEAEHFFKQEQNELRAWYLTTADKEAGLEPDGDGNHTAGAGRRGLPGNPAGHAQEPR